MGRVKYSHTNLVATDWKRIANFYINVFDCVQVGPIRRLRGDAIAAGTGLDDPEIEGVHLRLPGNGNDGPTLEIFQYKKISCEAERVANSRGLTHLAFEVADMEDVCSKVIRNGGWMLGSLARQLIVGVGTCTFIYVRDPDRNIIEIQVWEEA
ncbi:VOC family protein [Pseudomonas sp. BP8]|uniref:VOC family protein n=1 Tax=Pseudomonas sp. BP8 TaxID=2817864 RepID=UPI001AE80665|nr:VOC family protein [Pseudomonas sp. BP8]HDS1737946.1 VOC family protein [Pseudomonas putida]